MAVPPSPAGRIGLEFYDWVPARCTDGGMPHRVSEGTLKAAVRGRSLTIGLALPGWFCSEAPTHEAGPRSFREFSFARLSEGFGPVLEYGS